MSDNIEKGALEPVGVAALRLAISWCEYLEAHDRKLYAAELQRVPDNVREMATRLLAGEVPDGVTVRELYRHGWRGLKTPAAVNQALYYLATKAWVRTEKVPARGRPSEVLRVNPLLELRQEALAL